MRRLVLMLSFCLSSGWEARAQIGPPQPRAAGGGYSLGAGLHNVNSTWMPYDYDVARNRVYIEGSHAFNDSLEIFGRVGGSDFVINDLDSYEPGEFHDVSSQGYPAFFAGGLRGMLWRCGAWSFGASFEAALYAEMDKSIRWDYDVYQRLYFDATTEINAGVTLACDLCVGIVYGGPMLHFGYTRADVRTHEFGPDWDVEDHVNALTIRDKAGWGALLGWQMPIGEGGWSLQLEGSVLHGGFGGAVAFFKRS